MGKRGDGYPIRCHNISAAVRNFGMEHDLFRKRPRIFQRSLNDNDRIVPVRIRGRYLEPVRLQMDRPAEKKADIPVYASAAVPSAGLLLIIGNHLDFICFPIAQEIFTGHIEIGIAVRMASCIIPVYVHAGIGVNTLKFQHHGVPFPGVGNIQLPGIGIHISRVKPGLASVFRVGSPFFMYHGIVGQMNGYGMGISAPQHAHQPVFPGCDYPVIIQFFPYHGTSFPAAASVSYSCPQ